MSEKRIADLFKIGNRFLRSAHLERDFEDPTVLSGYVLTDFTRSCLERVTNGLKPHSGQRAWRMTGDYGCGKSSFALLLAHAFAGHDNAFPSQIRQIVDFHQFGVPRPTHAVLATRPFLRPRSSSLQPRPESLMCRWWPSASRAQERDEANPKSST